MRVSISKTPSSSRFYDRLRALQNEGFKLMPRLGDGLVTDDPLERAMVFREGDGGLVAILVDEDGMLWTYSEREGLVCEEATE